MLDGRRTFHPGHQEERIQKKSKDRSEKSTRWESYRILSTKWRNIEEKRKDQRRTGWGGIFEGTRRNQVTLRLFCSDFRRQVIKDSEFWRSNYGSFYSHFHDHWTEKIKQLGFFHDLILYGIGNFFSNRKSAFQLGFYILLADILEVRRKILSFQNQDSRKPLDIWPTPNINWNETHTENWADDHSRKRGNHSFIPFTFFGWCFFTIWYSEQPAWRLLGSM